MPFNQATRQNFLPAPVAAYTAGQTVYSNIPKVGLLKRIICLVTGTITVAWAAAPRPCRPKHRST
jgi:hypothetical protein